MTIKDKYEMCLRITTNAKQKLKVINDNAIAKSYLKFLNDYYNDAVHYAKKEEYETALEAIAYAHGFIDAGVLAGLFEIEGYHLEKI